MSIVGEALAPEINGQIKIRQEKYGKKSRTTEELQYFNLKSAWVKLVSSVDITDSYNPASADLKSILTEIKGSNLAKKFVLFNGTSDSVTDTDGTRRQRAGIARNGSILNQNAYGLGGNEFGLKPMPGIISASVKTENRGSLKTGTIKIKAWNRTQFEIIDLLYLRLGYSILLEFGNVMYYQNDGTFVKDNVPSLESSFLDNKYTTQGVLDAIQSLRLKSNGNYDALYGKVVNFDWSLDNDGSYDITVIVRSIGDVIESLKVNVLNDNSETTNSFKSPGAPALITAPNKLSDILLSFRNLFIEFLPNAQPGQSTTITPNTASPFNPSLTPSFLKSNATLSNVGYGSILVKGGGLTGIASEDDKVNFLNQVYRSGDSPTEFFYVRLGYLFKLLETQIFPKYNGKEPVLKFNTNIEDNICMYLSGIVPLNPNICVINTLVSYPASGNSYQYAVGGEPFTKNISGVKLGQIMNIYVNISWINQTIAELNNPQTITSLFTDMIEKLLLGIAGNVGGYNKFELHIDETSNTTYVIDQYPIPNRDQILKSIKKSTKDTNTIIQLFGYNRTNNISRASFVRDFGMQTSITPELATIITIGAQAGGSAGGQDATALSRLNQGLKDRIKPTVTDSKVPTAGAETTEDQIKDLNNKYPGVNGNFNKYATRLGTLKSADISTQPEYSFLVDEETYTVEEAMSALANICQYRLALNAIKTKSGSGSIGFIPVSVNLKIDGLSGIKIYNSLSIDTSYLPSNYPTTMDFIITGITHNLVNNDWITELNTIMVPNTTKADDSSDGSNNDSPPKTKPKDEGGQPDPSDWPKSTPSGFAMKPTGHEAKEYTKTQIVLHYSAGWQRADKNKQTVDILNSRHQRTAKSPKGIDNPPLGLSYHYGVDVTGHVENFIPEKYKAFHAGDANPNSIGINVQCIGFGSSATETNAGPSSKVAGQQPNVKLVDWNGKPKAYRDHTWCQEISDAQYNALLKLIPELAKRNPDIGSYVWEGEKTFKQLFPDAGTTTYKAGTPGLYTHCSITSKVDVLPTPKIVQLFKTLKF